MTIQLYSFPLSGHAHRVRLLLSLLGLEFETIDVDLAHGAHKQPDFLALNLFGQVPVLVHDGHVVADSNAIMVYLAKAFSGPRPRPEPGPPRGEAFSRHEWLPEDPVGAAAVQRWLSVAAGPIAYGPATARLITVFGAKYDPAEIIPRAHAILRLIDAELRSHTFLVGDRPTLADVACYSYVAHAPEGNVSLGEYPNIRAWLERIEALPGFVAMPATPVGLAG